MCGLVGVIAKVPLSETVNLALQHISPSRLGSDRYERFINKINKT